MKNSDRGLNLIWRAEINNSNNNLLDKSMGYTLRTSMLIDVLQPADSTSISNATRWLIKSWEGCAASSAQAYTSKHDAYIILPTKTLLISKIKLEEYINDLAEMGLKVEFSGVYSDSEIKKQFRVSTSKYKYLYKTKFALIKFWGACGRDFLRTLEIMRNVQNLIKVYDGVKNKLNLLYIPERYFKIRKLFPDVPKYFAWTAAYSCSGELLHNTPNCHFTWLSTSKLRFPKLTHKLTIIGKHVVNIGQLVGSEKTLSSLKSCLSLEGQRKIAHECDKYKVLSLLTREFKNKSYPDKVAFYFHLHEVFDKEIKKHIKDYKITYD